MLLASRGSGDTQSRDQGIGRPELALQTALGRRIPGLVTWANPYPAVGVFSWDWRQIANGAGAVSKLSGLGLGAYHDSVVTGTNLLENKLTAEISECGGKTALILAGYSQGAQVTADVYQRDISPDEQHQVAAVVLFGDPYFNGGDRSVDRGSFSGRRDGILGRRPHFAAGPTLVLSYCHSHDPICQGLFYRVGPTRTIDPGALTTLQHKNYTRFNEPETAARLIADRIAQQTGGQPASRWPTKRNDGPPALFLWLGASFISPDWSACDSTYCIVGSGSDVLVFRLHGIEQIGTIPLGDTDPSSALASLGIPTADIAALLKP